MNSISRPARFSHFLMPVSTRSKTGAVSPKHVGRVTRTRRSLSQNDAPSTGDDLSAFKPTSTRKKRLKIDESVQEKKPAATPPSPEIYSSTEQKRPSKRTARKTPQPVTPESPSSANIRSSPKQKRKSKLPVSRDPPKEWERTYSLVQELREDRSAPCDGEGCEALPDRSSSPKDIRFQILMSLMLSSQTKDAVVASAIRSMQRDGVLSVESISKMLPEDLNNYIAKVGFRNNKTKYIKQSVEVLKQKYDGDIPPSADEMMELPGVGPKMAYICENAAWGKQTGIGVDTHMHRLFNALGWVNSKNPEQTRVQLESWLPFEYWADVNLLWVGFGQEVQQFKPKALRKA